MNWQARTQPLKPGDEVAYSKAFLQSIGAHTGDIPFARGVVRSIRSLGPEVQIAEIDWKTPDMPEKVNVRNLCRVADIGREL